MSLLLCLIAVLPVQFVIFQMEYGHAMSDAEFKKHADSWVTLADQRSK